MWRSGWNIALAACLSLSACGGASASQGDAAASDGGDGLVAIGPVWQMALPDTGVLRGMVPGAGGVVVVGGPTVVLVSPDKEVLATGPMPAVEPGNPDSFYLANALAPTAGGGFKILSAFTPFGSDFALSEHDASLKQVFLTDTGIDRNIYRAAMVVPGEETFLLARTTNDNADLILVKIQAGSVVSRDVAAPDTTIGIDDVAFTASDGALLFLAGEPSAPVEVLRIDPVDGSLTKLPIPVPGNDSDGLRMLGTDDGIILLLSDGDRTTNSGVEPNYLTAVGLNSLGTEVTHRATRVQEMSRLGAFHFQVVGDRVVGIAALDYQDLIVSFDRTTFAPCPTARLVPPEGLAANNNAFLALYDGSLYAAVDLQDGATGYSVLDRLPPLDQAIRRCDLGAPP